MPSSSWQNSASPLLQQTDSPDAEIYALYRLISRTPPATLLGAKVNCGCCSTRSWASRPSRWGGDDMISLRQIANLVERQT